MGSIFLKSSKKILFKIYKFTMGEPFFNISSVLSFFYQDQNNFLKLSNVFQKNVGMFDKSMNIVNGLPSEMYINRFLGISYLSHLHHNGLEFALPFDSFKGCWLSLISMYEIIHEKTFETLVIADFFFL